MENNNCVRKALFSIPIWITKEFEIPNPDKRYSLKAIVISIYLFLLLHEILGEIPRNFLIQ